MHDIGTQHGTTLKSFFWFSALMPGPWSITSTTKWPSTAGCAARSTDPTAGPTPTLLRWLAAAPGRPEAEVDSP